MLARHFRGNIFCGPNDFIERNKRVEIARAMLAQQSALLAAMTFLPKHGASTRLAIGSQIKPNMDWKAREDAANDCF